MAYELDRSGYYVHLGFEFQRFQAMVVNMIDLHGRAEWFLDGCRSRFLGSQMLLPCEPLT